MTRFGYPLMTGQSGPKELVRYAVSAEEAGFDFEVSSDHYFPWSVSATGKFATVARRPLSNSTIAVDNGPLASGSAGSNEVDARVMGAYYPAVGEAARSRRHQTRSRRPATSDYDAGATAAISASGSVTLTQSVRSVIGTPMTCARTGGSMVNSTMPFDDPLTSHRPRQPCTPQAYTLSLFGAAVLMELSGIVARNPHPIATRRLPSSIRTSLCPGPRPRGADSGRNHRS